MWRILIVDDDQKYRKLLRGHFERVGHLVVEAGEGWPAIGLAETERPQVVLLDFDLPDAGDYIQTVRGVGYRLNASGS